MLLKCSNPQTFLPYHEPQIPLFAACVWRSDVVLHFLAMEESFLMGVSAMLPPFFTDVVLLFPDHDLTFLDGLSFVKVPLKL